MKMTDETKIIEMVERLMHDHAPSYGNQPDYGAMLRAAYAQGARDMREACAKACDAMHAREDDNCGEAAHNIRAIALPAGEG